MEVRLPISFSGDDSDGGVLATNLSQKGCTVVSDKLVNTGTFLVMQIQRTEQCTQLEVNLAAACRAVGLASWVPGCR